MVANVRSFLRESSPRQRVIGLAVAGGGALTLAILFLVLGTRAEYGLLYDQLSARDSLAISRVLDENRIPFRQSGTSIEVAYNTITQARLLLAERGLPTGDASVGYELFDRDQAFGTSNFVQEVNRLRALEGELARTISSLEPVGEARVHLVLPTRELFSRDQQPPSASVTLSLIPGQRMDARQIQAISHLVAAAVPKLQLEDISIVDTRGTLLKRPATEGELFQGATPDEIRNRYETRLGSELERLVSEVVGFGNVRVQVRADMNFDQTVVREEIFDPESQVLRSSEEIEENTQTTDRTDTAVTLENNLPEGVPNQAGGLNRLESSSRVEAVSNFEISRTETNRVEAPGEVERLSVAVLLDGVYPLQSDGTAVYQPRPEAEISAIDRLVKSAIGYDETLRGDVVEIVNLRFAAEDFPREVATTTPEIFGLPADVFQNIFETLVIGLIILLIALFLVRPVVANVFQTLQTHRQKTAEGVSMAAAAAGEAGPGGIGGLGGIGGIGGLGEGPDLSDTHRSLMAGLFQEAEIAGLGLSDIDEKIRNQISRQLGELMRRHPEHTTQVFRDWLAE